MPFWGSFTSSFGAGRRLRGRLLASYLFRNGYPAINPANEVLKIDFEQETIAGITDQGRNSYTLSYNAASPETVYSFVSGGPYSSTGKGFRSLYAVNQNLNAGTAFTAEDSDAIFTGENDWSIEWWGKYQYGTTNPIGFERFGIYGQPGNIGFKIEVLVANASDYRITVGSAVADGTTGNNLTRNITYTDQTWAHFVVAWKATSATAGRLYIWVNGEEQINEAVNKFTNQDFYRTSNQRTSFFTNPSTSLGLENLTKDFRVMDVADPWIAGFSSPKSSFSGILTAVDEGESYTITVDTVGVDDETTLYWTLTNAGDFDAGSGSFVINSNTGNFTITPTADITTEGEETFTISIRTNSTTGPIVATSGNITINDTSTT